jgi:hypothetical protein
MDRDENVARNMLKERIEYGTEYRKFWLLVKELFRKIDLYFWKNLASAS